MGLIKWIKRELDSSNSCKRRQSEPPLSGITEQLPRDESYVKALSKFNEWRRKQHFGGSVRLTRKQSKKLTERRGQSEQFFEKRYTPNDKDKNIKPLRNGLYEEIQVNILERDQHDEVLNKSPRRNIYEKPSTNRSFPVADIVKTRRRPSSSSNKSNDTQIYENVIIDIIDQFDRNPDILEINQKYLSPPVKFFKENSNPFANVHTPIRNHPYQDTEKSTHNDDWAYESPRNLKSLEALRENFKPFEPNEDKARKSISSECRLSRNPHYQTVINKHGEEVEYALPLNEKLEEELERKPIESDSRIIALNNTSSYQQYIEDNFEFLNENDRLGLSHISVSFSNNQFQNGSVLVTDLDGTSGTKPAVDNLNYSKEHNIVKELEAIELWSRNIDTNIDIERHIVKKTTPDMHFGEIIVCNTNEVTEKCPRQLFETLNGTLHSGTFHCIPVRQFKPKHGAFADSNLQLNYEVLRKIRHPDIVLLMGITVDNKCALDSLILEPLDYSLYHFIHQELGCIPISICLLYTLQINSAVTYLHKHGLIHSNISTHTIVMCHLSKAVKLTSFELTTTTNKDLLDELMEFFQNEKYENELPSNINDLPSKLRPYNIEYRKMFSKHNHQAPELLSNRVGFVFPKIQSDVYGICLMLWEMINCSIPFADFDYDEMAKLIYLQNAQLPMLRENRQKSFEKVLKLGLNMLAEKRIADTIELKEALSDISIESDDQLDVSNEGEKMISEKNPLEGISSLLYNKGFGPMISECTSTIKKRKHFFKEDRISAKQLFVYSQINKSNDPSEVLNPSQTSSPDSSQYGFEIGEVSIPETPIARSNKLRKTAWLSNQSISPIVHLEIKSKDDDAANNQIEIVEKNTYNALKSEDTSSNKLYNVNIRIRPNSKKQLSTPTSKEDDLAQSPIENSSLNQAHNNLSQISDYIKFFNLVSTQHPKPLVHSPFKIQSPVENLVNYNTNASKPTQATEKMLNQQPEPMPMDQNSINEFFSRSHATSDFENSLWHREKQKCVQSVKSQRRISVKDAVNKFESFSKSILSESISPKPPKRTISSSATSSSEEKKKDNSNFKNSKNDDDCEKNISKINIILQNKSESIKASEEKIDAEIVKSKENTECIPKPPVQPNHNSILTLNFKKLDRRASDLGSYYVRQNPTTKALTARHSIYGSEIFKRLRKPKASTGNENEGNEEKPANKATFNTNIFHDKNKDFKIKVGKLTCLNCGHKLFVVDDIVHSNNEEDLNETFSELLLTPLKRNFGLQHVSKSTEDFYIDDDFCEDIELCANMELGTQTHLSDYDFDVFSAEIFNSSEEKASHIT